MTAARQKIDASLGARWKNSQGKIQRSLKGRKDQSARQARRAKVLTGWGMKASLAADGASALNLADQAESCGEPFQVILLDYQMPDMDGLTLAEQIRKGARFKETPIILLASVIPNDIGSRCRELGFASHLTKPLSQRALQEAIRSFFAGRAVDDLKVSQHEDAEPEPAGPRLRILLAEDSEVNQRLAVRTLEKRGHTVVVAENGVRAVDLFQQESFDLILMDVQMPEMNGFEATQAIRRKEAGTASHIPILAMTARAMKGDQEECISAGMDAYLSKPVRPNELLKVIREMAIRSSQRTGDNHVVVDGQSGPEPQIMDTQALLEIIDGDFEFLRELAATL
ncbi:MAG: response regulator, partial [Blastocatellia bacterium]